MNPKILVGFALVTAIVTAAALITVANRYWISAAASSVRPFPGLLDHINDVAEIDVKAKAGTTVIKRAQSGWVMTDKNDYPVQAELARRAAIGFGEMELVERKTTQPDRYARLGVEDLDSENAKSRLVTLKDAKGDTMAELIVGKRREGRLSGQGGVYVRRPGDAQSWFAPVNFEIQDNPVFWLEQRIIHINPKRVAQITTVQPDGETLAIFKADPKTPHFAFKNLPENKKLKGEAVADDMNSILSTVDLADVALQSDVDFSQKAWHADVKTFDGLDVKVDLVTRNGKTWAHFTAAAEKPLADRETQPDEVKKFFKPANEVADEAAEINAHVGKWAYEIQGEPAEKLTAQLAIFLENETPPKGDNTGGFGPTGPGGEPGESPPPSTGEGQ